MRGLWKYRLAVIGVFLLGLVSGAAGMYIYKRKQDQQAFRQPDTVARVVAQRLGDDFGLSPRQEEEVFLAVNAARADLIELLRDRMPQILLVALGAVQRIRNAMDESQRAEFDRWLGERREHLQKLLGDQTPVPLFH
ncbi:MAG: hypothetical protein KA419_18850 [Acidobacteria bacterium]|nr:hypothetical protein [Acidobacteriota bacterium]